MLSGAFSTCLVALLFLLSISGAHATEPILVSGTFDYVFTITGERWADGHWFIEAVEYEDWVGSFEGTAVSFFRVVWFNFPSGPLNVWLRGDFEGTAMGRSGTMVIQLVGWRYLPGEWAGQWVILSGTGELANLHGQGTWWGPGFGAVGPDIYYSGSVHFEPD